MSLSTSSLGYGCHLHDSTVVIVVVVNTRPRAIPLAMITMRKSIHEFPLHSYMGTYSTSVKIFAIAFYQIARIGVMHVAALVSSHMTCNPLRVK